MEKEIKKVLVLGSGALKIGGGRKYEDGVREGLI